MTSTALSVTSIRIDGGTQPRAEIVAQVVAEYAEDITNGARFPPVVVFFDGANYWLADGFHRYHAARSLGLATLEAEVRQGTLDDAKWYSYSVNQAHGLRRTNEDKRRAVEAALAHPFAGRYSDNQIAVHCGVSQPFVSKIRPSYNDYKIEPGRIVTRGNSTYTMQTANIGRRETDTDAPTREAFRYQGGYAHCTHCDATHDRWTLTDDGVLWVCELCGCATADHRMDLRTAPQATTSAIQNAVANETPAKLKTYVTLDEWNAGHRLPVTHSTATFNATNDNIEWAAWSWNPVTGCLHNCAYCYARDIANRFYPYGFQPAFIPERLDAPANTRQGAPRWQGDIGYRNVFTCSMADLFGKWTPTPWIEAVLQAAADNPQWTFLFLSKFPSRMAEFSYPQNVWLGATVDKQHAVERAESAFRKIKAHGFNGVCWLSCEPMLEQLTFSSLEMFDWLVMGGASKSTQTAEFRPPVRWWARLLMQADDCRIPVYMKTNLGLEHDSRIREYPQK